MIFNMNESATLAATNIPMAEGYNCFDGAALALIDSASNEMSMFEAMIGADYRELQIQKESANGIVQEGAVAALHEASAKEIGNKVKELLTKLVAKIKAIFTSLFEKIEGLVRNDTKLVAKYKKSLLEKDLSNVKFKWAEVKKSAFDEELPEIKVSDDYKDSAADRVAVYLGCKQSEYAKTFKETHYGEVKSDATISDIGGIAAVCDFVSEYSKEIKALRIAIKQYENNVSAFVKNAKLSKTASKALDAGDDVVGEVNKTYQMAQAFQTASHMIARQIVAGAKFEYKQNKAAFMKAVGASGKGEEKSDTAKAMGEAAYLEMVQEAAEQEVEDVIDGAISNEELSDICNAALNVKDADVSDDPEKNVYDKVQHYSTSGSEVDTDGVIDTDYDSKEESYNFSAMLY